MKKEKKETSNIVIYLCILLLILIIAIPPILRTFVPKEEANGNIKTQKEKIVLLTCNKKSEDGLSQINAKTKFVSEEANTVTITYSILDTSTESVAEGQEDIAPPSTTEEVTPDMNTTDASTQTFPLTDPALDVFRNLTDANVTEDQKQFTVSMTQKTLTSNESVEAIHNYFNLLPNQTQYYEELGYTCTKLEA